MGDTSIRLSEESKTRLDMYKRKGETYDDVIQRLTRRDKWAAFGMLAEHGDELREGVRRVRRETNEDLAGDVE